MCAVAIDVPDVVNVALQHAMSTVAIVKIIFVDCDWIKMLSIAVVQTKFINCNSANKSCQL